MARVKQDPRLEEMAEAAKQDADYQETITAIKELPDAKSVKELGEHPAKEYTSIWHELSLLETHRGTIIMRGNQIVVPKRERNKCLALLHKTHQGLVKTSTAARECYHWPGMNHEVEKLRGMPEVHAVPEKKNSQY